MRTTLLRVGALTGALLASTAFVTPAQAQSTPPPYRNLDANGVDLTHGDFVLSFVEGAIGAGQAELALIRDGVWYSGFNGHRWDTITLTEFSGNRSVAFGQRAEWFTGTTSDQGSGSTLTLSGSTYIYRTADGTTTSFERRDPNCTVSAPGQSCIWIPMSIGSPDGRAVDLSWQQWLICPDVPIEEQVCTVDSVRLTQVSNSYGYAIGFTYAEDGGGGTSGPSLNWLKRTRADFYNSAAGTSSQGNVTYAYPSTGVTQVTDLGGRVWRIAGDTSVNITAVRRPGAGSDTTTISRSSGIVTSVTRDGVTTGYSRSVSGSTATMTVTNALSQQTVVVSDLTIGRPTSVTDPLSRTTGYQYDSSGRLTRVTAPEGNYVHYTYDARGNVTETRRVAKSGSGLADIVTWASFDTTCSQPVTCNQPNSTTDARGFRTDYTYDSTHGGLLTVTAPAPSGSAPVGSGTRPETRYAYTLTNGEYRLTEISACASGTASSCVGTAAESRTVIGYGTDANANVVSVERRDGTGALTATTAMTYDARGDLLTRDGPISGTADTTRYRYNAARQIVGVIGPDPDGGGSLKHRALRATYTNGLRTSVEQGNVNSQSDTDWAAFAPAQKIEQDYDANARPTVQRLMSGSTTYQLTETTHDGLGRVRCVAQRMNPAEFATAGSDAVDACALDTQGTGTNNYGPDRITRTTYDNAGQVTKVETGYGVSGVAADEVTATYTSNGLPQTVTDANGNWTYLNYDGFDRQNYRVMPHPTSIGSWNWGDYDYFGYDAAGNLSGTQLRDGTRIEFTYDNLNRVATKDLPGSEPTVTYGYDLLGRRTSAATSGHTLTFGFDALGRNTSQAGPLGTVSYGYDLAGRRTSMTYPGTTALVVGYSYNVAGDLTEIRENPAGSNTSLATYTYDDRGRRTLLTRGNGTTSTYTYDDVSRMTQLAENLGGSTYDQTLTFGHNPAGQIATTTRSNDNYAWGGHYAVTRAYTVNGLNQYTAAGAVTPTYDTRGNLTAAGGASYAYSSENMLTSAWGVGSLAYDPLNRLFQTSGGSTTRMLYDGQRLIAEYDSSNALQRRYVHGPGTDEPLVWYEGTGLSTRRYYHADERGSIVATSDGSGALVNINSYDEYGIPGSGNSGRFQYTGQQWLSEFGMYHYRARIYSPTLGRFLQTDPIGFAGGMNLYAYVGNDPVNFTDPSGLQCRIIELSSWHVWNGATGEYLGTEDGEVHTRVRYCNGGGSQTFFEGGTGGPDGGGHGDGDGPNQPQSRREREACERLQQTAEDGRAALRWFNNRNWDDVPLMTAYRNAYLDDAASLSFLDSGWWDAGSVAGGGVVSWVLRSDAVRGLLGGLGFSGAATVIINNGRARLDHARESARTLGARLDYLRICRR